MKTDYGQYLTETGHSHGLKLKWDAYLEHGRLFGTSYVGLLTIKLYCVMDTHLYRATSVSIAAKDDTDNTLSGTFDHLQEAFKWLKERLDGIAFAINNAKL